MKKSRSKKSRSQKMGSFGEQEFVRSLWKTMKKQEKKDASVGLLHERLESSMTMIGLTGGIASGKSTVAKIFQEKGIPVIDADEIARLVVQPGKKAYQQIVASFGEGILLKTGEIDRQRLAEIVFADDSKRVLLEAITHPEILKEILKSVKELKKKHRLVIIDAALLFESGLFRQMHRNILVRIDPEIQLKRLQKRNHLSEMEAWKRILAQMPGPEKEKRADFVIDNSESLEKTRHQIQEILARLHRAGPR